VRIICIGTHPDHCEIEFGGGAGYHVHPAAEFAAIRKRKAAEAARRLGIVPRIRQWNADIVLTHRPWDYHPDHQYTGLRVQDSVYKAMAPWLCPDTPAVRHDPLENGFQLPVPFVADVAIGPAEIQHAEAFQIREYGRRASRQELDEILPR
jgi:hypothetical protein